VSSFIKINPILEIVEHVGLEPFLIVLKCRIKLTYLYNIYTIYSYNEAYIMATKTLNIAIDEKLLIDIDNAVKRDMGTRSEYFRRLALADLERRKRWDELFAAGRAAGEKMGVVSEDQVYRILEG
jgi:hypothetical protein